ncbi:MAG TPA: hypothetical protein VHD81_01845 [Mycobacteriales bacterium]|nr:hypothetical protein [Mycobacteriales bacterium]
MVDVRRTLLALTTATTLFLTALTVGTAAPAAATTNSAPHATWRAKKPIDFRIRAALKKISCPTPSFCAAVSYDGTAVVEHKHNGDWARAEVLTPDHRLIDVSCPTEAFCIATDARDGWYQWNGHHWSNRRLLPGASTVVAGEWSWVACPSTTYCLLAQKDSGNVFVWSGQQWAPGPAIPPLGPARVTDVDCPTTDTCFAATGTKYPTPPSGNVYLFHDDSWSLTGPGLGYPVRGLTCPSVSYCAATLSPPYGGYGYTAYEWAGGAWAQNTPADVYLMAISCAAVNRCVGQGWDGSTSTFNGVTWSPATGRIGPAPRVPDGGFKAIDCATVDSCTAITDRHAATYSPTVGLHDYKFADPDAGPIGDLSCPTPHFCAATDYGGQVTVMRHGVWRTPVRIHPTPEGDGGLYDVSCTSPTFCLGLGSDAAYLYDGRHWSDPIATRGLTLNRESCASPTFCGFVSGANSAVIYNGKSFSTPERIPSGRRHDSLRGISCPTPGFCAAISAFSIITWSHGTWHRNKRFFVKRSVYLSDLSCSSANRCVVTGNGGWYELAHGRWRWHRGGVGGGVSCAGKACLSVAGSGGSATIGKGDASRLYQAHSEDVVSCATASLCFVARDNRLGTVQKVTLS